MTDHTPTLDLVAIRQRHQLACNFVSPQLTPEFILYLLEQDIPAMLAELARLQGIVAQPQPKLEKET